MNRIPFETDKFFTGNAHSGLPDAGVWKIRSSHCAIDIQHNIDLASMSVVDVVSLEGQEGFYLHLDTKFYGSMCPHSKYKTGLLPKYSCMEELSGLICSDYGHFSTITCDMWKCAGIAYDLRDNAALNAEVISFRPTKQNMGLLILDFLRLLSLRKVFAKDNLALKAQFDASVIEEDPATGLKSLLMYPDRLEYGNTGVLSAMMAVNCAYRWETRAGVGR
jgi:hypothetical protein